MGEKKRKDIKRQRSHGATCLGWFMPPEPRRCSRRQAPACKGPAMAAARYQQCSGGGRRSAAETGQDDAHGQRADIGQRDRIVTKPRGHVSNVETGRACQCADNRAPTHGAPRTRDRALSACAGRLCVAHVRRCCLRCRNCRCVCCHRCKSPFWRGVPWRCDPFLVYFLLDNNFEQRRRGDVVCNKLLVKKKVVSKRPLASCRVCRFFLDWTCRWRKRVWFACAFSGGPRDCIGQRKKEKRDWVTGRCLLVGR